jgi:hypothetical protein
MVLKVLALIGVSLVYAGLEPEAITSGTARMPGMFKDAT